MAGSIAVLAEKPSVARDLARALGASARGEGYLHGNGYVVTWAIGHLAALAQPHEINPQWREWRRDRLPMIPDDWPLVVYEQTKDQFETVRKILTSPKIGRVVCATDAGREGELIFRYIYEAAGCQKPFDRLWISSLTPEAIRQGFSSLRPGGDYNPLADAARGRSRADWLVGLNLSRAYSLAYGEDLSVGRVQTPTLAMVVERELEIRAFVPEDYFEVVATFHPQGAAPEVVYKGTWFREAKSQEEKADKESLRQLMRLPASGDEARQVVERARSGAAAIESITLEKQRMAPPLLYDLTELQRHANRLYGFSAQKTLDIAQALYERHKLISYPRTDSRHLPADVAKGLGRIVEAIAGPYRELLAPGTGERPLGKRYVDDAKVTDHHAIIPTTSASDLSGLTPDERKIHDMVCRRLLSAWHGDHVTSVTTVITAIFNSGITDRYHTSGTTILEMGWKVLDIAVKKKANAASEGEAEQALPPGLAQGQPQDVVDAEALRKKTRPPKRLTEATLLTAMETAGKTLDEKELSDAMKESGLGTPATRAGIIEVLLKRDYIVRNGKMLEATDKGIRLIEVVHPEVKSPVMTGQWEAFLKRIERGNAELRPFLTGIEDYVREVVGKVGHTQAIPRARAATSAGDSHEAPPQAIPAGTVAAAAPEESLEDLLHRGFGFTKFRPNQREVCEAVVAGRDVLLVMPTGSGKSLCYQLPGLARGGTTLVISPLIALMEDQVAKLRARGFAVERIHSGRDRAASRQASLDYLAGKLQFLFIAPERMRVAGFPEMLAKRKPSLIAIDEAHCISQWGHDFRPDYRLLGNHLPALRPAPVIGLTATATPLVQDDIVLQLELDRPAPFIHGFRRDNIAIEVVEVAPSSRAALVVDLLDDDARRPAIVYVPTRKQAMAVAEELKAHFPAAPYHAGLDADRRARVQQEFLEGKVSVMVATIAFGMGIDKADIRTVIHTALPSSLESYYQEIGRAGRDGDPSRAVLMHSYADRHTHDFFFERDYPDVAVLDEVYRALGNEPQDKEMLAHRLRIDEDLLDKAIEKLWMQSGAIVDFAGNITVGHPDWRDAYRALCDQKRSQLELMLRYAETQECRMSAVVRHFGDRADAQTPCGICDFCSPENCLAQQFPGPTPEEKTAVKRILASLRDIDNRSTGKLHGELYSSGKLTRDEFEEVLGAMARQGWIRLVEAEFETGGRVVPYRKAALTNKGRSTRDPDFTMMVIKAAHATRTTAEKKKKQKPKKAEPAPAAPVNAKLEEALKQWRLTEARRLAVPAFRIMTDKSLRAIVVTRPASAGELLAIPGLGINTVEKYGRHIYKIVRDNP